ncbi:MAG: hypothetical protein M1818_004784 [Claussenomyces sp. TS43310]|nr:MAG: hypothetical protein M1818_004784 [Claussenomyces sp. TS43310]
MNPRPTARQGLFIPALRAGSGRPSVCTPLFSFIWAMIAKQMPENFHAALTGLGISSSKDGAAGDAFGFYWGPSAERPSDETRSSARIGYYDSASNRTNLQLIAEQQVTRLIFSNCSTGIHVDGVAFRASASAAEQIVSANKEVILAAGSIHTPQLLQLSGIGDFSSLAKVQPNLKVDLPGVGNNFQDHQFVTLVYNFSNNSLSSANMTENSTFAAQAAANYSQSATGPLTYNSASAFAFLPLANYSNSSSQILGEANSTPSAAHLDNSTPAAVVAGYKAQRELVLEALSSATSASMEYIWSDAGLSVAIVKPLSRGSVQIATLNPFVQPLVNWRALTDPTDLEMLDAGVGFARLLMTQPETAILGPTEVVPGLATDAQTFIRSQLTTVYHPAGTCSMLARELGGVVDARLKVYGTDNLRVVDASIFPILPATHTQTSVYAVAEKASDLIKEDNQSS